MINQLWQKRAIFFAWGLIALGVVLRLRQFLARRALWLDEAMLSLNIINRSWAGLFDVLDDHQGAPVGFLLAQKLITQISGTGELSLRLLPFLAGCLALIAFYFLLRRLVDGPALYVGLALFAVSEPLIYYSNEVKQYSLDVLITIGLILLALNLISEQLTVKKTALFALAGMLTVWFSHPAVFVLAGIGFTWFIKEFKNRSAWPHILITGLAWLSSFGLLYWFNLKNLVADSFLLNYWQEYFLPLDATAFNWLINAFNQAMQVSLTFFENNLLLPILGLIGLIYLIRKQALAAMLIGFSLLATLVGSTAGIYPFAGRMILFTVPLWLIFIATGLEAITRLINRPSWLNFSATIVLVGLVLFQPAQMVINDFIQPPMPENFRPAMAELKANQQPGQPIYVYAWAVPAFRYYAPQYLINMDDVVWGQQAGGDMNVLINEVEQFRGQPRVWLIFSHVYQNHLANEYEGLTEYLKETTDIRRKFIEPRSSVYLLLIDFSVIKP